VTIQVNKSGWLPALIGPVRIRVGNVPQEPAETIDFREASAESVDGHLLISPDPPTIVDSINGILPKRRQIYFQGSVSAADDPNANRTVIDVIGGGGAGTTPTGTGLRKVSAGVENVAASLLVNADVSSSAAIDGSKISPSFGAQSLSAGACSVQQLDASDYVQGQSFRTDGVLPSDGTFRLANSRSIKTRNGANSANICMMQSNVGDVLFIGQNSSFAEQTFNLIQGASSNQYFAINSQYIFALFAGAFELYEPIRGGTSPYGLHGQVASARAVAAYTVPAAEYQYDSIRFAAAVAAGTVTFPQPINAARSYTKEIVNQSGATITISNGAGTTRTLATGSAQRFRFLSTGVEAASPVWTP
jgi:hypothetical protein